MTGASDQLQVVFFGLAAPLACSVLVGVFVFATAIAIHARELRERRAAKRARLDVLERRYAERLTARNSRPAVVLHINQRRVARPR